MSDIPADDTLSPTQHNALYALLTEPTIRQAAKAADVSERQVYRWLKTPAFADEYRAVRRAAMQQAIARLQQFSGHAAATLVQLMAVSNPAAVRLAAAAKVLEFGIKGTEIEDLRDEIERLYALVREQMTDEPPDV
jgi:uncharacterized protein with ATP-grasp and redox domains